MSTKTKHVEMINTQHISIETGNTNKSVPNRKMRLRRRKKRKSLKHGKPTTPVPLMIRRDNALSYLRLWNDDKETWSFKKNIQYWLLNNMYDKKQVGKKDFKLLLKYLEGLKGYQRNKLIQDSQEILNNYEKDSNINRRQYKRAINILRTLIE